VAMEVMVAVQSGTLLHALRVPLKRRVSARRGGDYVLRFVGFWFLYATPCSILPLQRRARRHATVNVVDFSDVTRCQNMVDVMSKQNICTQIKM